MKKIIFNSSMPRSGSELLQVILHQNPMIYGSPTSPLCEYMSAIINQQNNPEVKSQPDELMRPALFNSLKCMYQGYYEKITDRLVVCDKSRQWMWHYDVLEKSLGEKPKMICMVRDLRDVLASMEMNWRKNRHLPVGPDNATDISNMTVRERVAWFSQAHPVGFSAQRLKNAGELNQLQNVHIISYEELTLNPDKCMQKLYEYLELPYYQHDFNNIVKEVVEDHRWHGPYGNHDVQKVLKPSVSKWYEVLGQDIGWEIVEGFQWFYAKFYPQVMELHES